MAVLPEEASKAWDNREGAIIFTTVDKNGIANSIYATCVSKFNEEKLVVADNYFNKTRQNLLEGSSKGNILYITKEGKAYQVKGSVERLTAGPEFEDMKKWNDPKHPGLAAAVLTVEEVYKGGEQLL